MDKTAKMPIGMFDSGVGGLTVLKALRERMPCEQVVYLGDTARLPYGTKSSQTVSRYAVQCAAELVSRGIKLLVVACNTASAVALGPCARRIQKSLLSVWSNLVRRLPAWRHAIR